MKIGEHKFYLLVAVVLFIFGAIILLQFRITPTHDDSQKITPSKPETIGLYGLTGRIENIKNNSITILVDQKQAFIKNPVWNIIITSQTKIKARYLNKTLIRDDTEEGYGYNKPFEDKEISSKELSIGDYIAISTRENIINKAEAVADEITRIIITE